MVSELSNHFSQSFFQLHPEGKYLSEWVINFESKIVFITINKCAGSTIRHFLRFEKKFEVFNNNEIEDKDIVYLIDNHFTFYSVIRDPNDRYVSGLQHFLHFINNNTNEYKYRLHKFMSSVKRNGDLYNIIEENIKNNEFIFDEHLLPQSESLKELFKFTQKINFIRFDNNLSKKISSIIKDESIMPKSNTSDEKEPEIIIFSKMMYDLYCKNNKKFQELYKKDYEFYNMSL